METLALSLTSLPPGVTVKFDPTLVRGMGYYTGTIYEIAHPESGSSVGGGGRYDGMIGRFLGQDVPAAGFSIGFERVVDLVAARDDVDDNAVVLVHDLLAGDLTLERVMSLKSALVAQGKRVRLERRAKNLNPVLDRAKEAGYSAFAFVTAETVSVTDLSFKPLA
jgi:histidyl-tRNA synthetase